MEISGALRNKCNSLFLEAKLSRFQVCVSYALFARGSSHHLSHLRTFCHVFLSRSTTWKNCHVWGFVRFAPIAPLRLSDLLSIRFPESQILHGCRSRCTWHSYSKLVKSLWTRWNSFRSLNEGNSNLTNKNAVKLFLRKMECANASPSHQTNGQAGFICTLFMLCGFMYTLNVVWCIVWFYVHFPPKWGVSVCRGTRLRFGQLWVLTLQKRQSGRETEQHKSPKDKWAQFSKRVEFLFNIAKDDNSVEKKSSTKTQTELQWTLGSSSKNLSNCVEQKKFVCWTSLATARPLI